MLFCVYGTTVDCIQTECFCDIFNIYTRHLRLYNFLDTNTLTQTCHRNCHHRWLSD